MHGPLASRSAEGPVSGAFAELKELDTVRLESARRVHLLNKDALRAMGA